jgi:hypothetical protein
MRVRKRSGQGIRRLGNWHKLVLAGWVISQALLPGQVPEFLNTQAIQNVASIKVFCVSERLPICYVVWWESKPRG